MSASATPKQGDHVFNAIETAVMAPFETIRKLRSSHVDGQHFLYDYLLHSYSLAHKISEEASLLPARKFAASAGAEHDALREIANMQTRFPALARLNPSVLREVHLHNAAQFGEASERFEFEFLSTVQESLEAAVDLSSAKRAAGRTASPGIACQQLLGAAYDPAAALVVITTSMSRELLPSQSRFHALIARIAETLDRPAMWKDPYIDFHEERQRTTTTGGMINDIREVMTRLDLFKMQTSVFATLVRDEIAQKARSTQAESAYGPMLHLVHTRLQQMRLNQ